MHPVTEGSGWGKEIQFGRNENFILQMWHVSVFTLG
jgi:hypothetical protein